MRIEQSAFWLYFLVNLISIIHECHYFLVMIYVRCLDYHREATEGEGAGKFQGVGPPLVTQLFKFSPFLKNFGETYLGNLSHKA